MKVSFTHLIAWAIVQAAREWPVMARSFEERDGKPFAIEGSSVNLGIAVDVERKRRLPQPHGPRDQGRRRPRLRGLPLPLRGADRQDPREQPQPRRLPGHEHHADQPRRHRHGRLGSPPAERPERDRRRRLDRLPARVGPRAARDAAPARRLEGDDADLDLRPPRHPGGRVGRLPAPRSSSCCRARTASTRGSPPSLGVDPAPITAAHAASASAPPLGAAAPAAATPTAAAPDEELLQAVQAATSLLKGYRTHGHLAARLDPLGCEPKGDPAIQPESLDLTPELMAQIPASILRIGVPGETLLEALPRMREAYCGTIAYQFEHLSSHQQRTWLREMVETGAHRKPLADDEKRRLLGATDRRLRVRALPREGLPRAEDVLDRGARRGRADARRAGRPSPTAAAPRRSSSGWPTAAGSASSPTTSAARSSRSSPSSRAAKRIEAVKAVAAIPHGGTGDVKYHYGHQGIYETQRRREDLRPPLPEPQPPRVRRPGGAPARARFLQSEFDGPTPRATTRSAPCPVLLHGDAAFPGAGGRRRDAQPPVAEGLQRPAAPSTSSRTTRSASPPIPRTPAPPPTPPTWRRASTSRSSTSTPTTSRPAPRRSAWRWPTASAGAATSSST